MEKDKTVLLVGGPDAGKTNYLGRLWLAIRSQQCQLQPDGIPDELTYLNEVVNSILQGNFAQHTPVDVRENVVIPVKVDNTTPTFQGNLVVPDVSGEEWLKIYRNREWSEEWENSISSVTGCLLFVRVESDNNIPAVDWATWSHLLESPPTADGQIPTQVVLVDWLQCLQQALLEGQPDGFRPRFAIVLTAYDSVPKEQQNDGPTSYLKANFPLLWQYINSNKQQLDINVFGVSIAGGDFKADAQFKTKYLKGKPDKAGYVICDTNSGPIRSPDLTLPVAWAFDHLEIDELTKK